MSIYTLAFVITKYRYKSSIVMNGKEFRTWNRPGHLDQVKYAHDVGIKSLELFEVFFGVDFPLPKMDMIGIPNY